MKLLTLLVAIGITLQNGVLGRISEAQKQAVTRKGESKSEKKSKSQEPAEEPAEKRKKEESEPKKEGESEGHEESSIYTERTDRLVDSMGHIPDF